MRDSTFVGVGVLLLATLVCADLPSASSRLRLARHFAHQEKVIDEYAEVRQQHNDSAKVRPLGAWATFRLLEGLKFRDSKELPPYTIRYGHPLPLPPTVAPTNKPCVFLHGSGLTDDEPPTTSFPDYWGEVENFTPQCASHTFNHHDTVSRRYDDPVLMAGYCALLTNGSGIIDNKIIFTHSMGNLILAAALRAGYCSLAQSSSWYEVSGPLFGSKACDTLRQICQSDYEPLRDLAAKFNYCKSKDKGEPNPAYLSMRPSDANLTGLAEIVSKHVKGAMCGVSAFGLFSLDSLELEALAAVVGYGSANDGMVAITSCQNTQGTWGQIPQDNFYLAAINHADSTCRHGDGSFGFNRLPCSWFRYRT